MTRVPKDVSLSESSVESTVEFVVNMFALFCDVKCRSTRYGCCHDGKTPAKGPYFQGCKEPCQDERSSYFCQSIVRAGFCGKPRFKQFSNLCLNSCRMCRPCEDSASTECPFFARRGRCDTDKSKTYNRCRKSCHVCGVKDPCQGFICTKPNTRCRVDHLGVPYCGCRVHCDPGDHFTGTVCGRDGKEYKNKCRLLHSNCEIPNIAKIQNYGKCPSLNIKEPCIDQRSRYFCQSIARAGFCNKRHLQKTVDMCKHSCKKC
uniref:Uncharacterized protein n=1 Tax=Clytia hemisphaerica TaxID=252671 RepID=A0A7M5WVL7_9CNID